MSRYVLVVVGTSYGGLQAMSTMLDGIPAGFGAAIAFVQHRSKDSDETLVRVLQEHSVLPVREAEDKMPIRTGRVYVAPPDYHLLVDAEFFALSTEAPVGFSRPSIDVFLESAAEAFGSRVIGVVLTGANADGARGLGAVKAAGDAGCGDRRLGRRRHPSARGDRPLPLRALLPVSSVFLTLLGRRSRCPAPPGGSERRPGA